MVDMGVALFPRAMDVSTVKQSLAQAINEKDGERFDRLLVEFLLSKNLDKDSLAVACDFALKRLGVHEYNEEAIKKEDPSDCWFEMLIHKVRLFLAA